ncbi:MAG: hypothetical protein IPP69_15235 [Flavobacteriales bacterium]|nr:hypothetical protein [Flavobacteriales bacterium]
MGGIVDAGVWKFDGKLLTNYTTQDGLTSDAVNTIYKDNSGTMWFGTDANGICNSMVQHSLDYSTLKFVYFRTKAKACFQEQMMFD